jgi:tRNA A37 threonylcarbamoyladenosine modification protein TsaB
LGSGPIKLAGSAATDLAAEAMALGLKANIADLNSAPDVLWVARLGLSADPAAAAPKPLYLRPPTATPQEGKAVPRQGG